MLRFPGFGCPRRKISPKFHSKNGVKNGKFHANFTLLWRGAGSNNYIRFHRSSGCHFALSFHLSLSLPSPPSLLTCCMKFSVGLQARSSNSNTSNSCQGGSREYVVVSSPNFARRRQRSHEAACARARANASGMPCRTQPFPRTLPKTFSEPFLERCVTVRPLRRAAKNRARKMHINFEHINFLKVGTTLGQPAGQPY